MSDKAYKLWQDTIDRSKNDPRWNGHDTAISGAVDAYNKHLSQTKGFAPLDWRIVKAMVWTETGGPDNPAWNLRPMQIGNPGDPGLDALLSTGPQRSPIAPLVVPPSFKSTLTIQTARSDPAPNIRAGTGYLFLRFAKFQHASVADTSDPIRNYTVRPNDSFARIAERNGSTVQELQALNPKAKMLQPGQVIRIRKASIQPQITGWTPMTVEKIASLYNIGDKLYSKKLNYCLDLIKAAP